MKIIHKRIRVPQNYLTSIAAGNTFDIALADLVSFTQRLTEIGYIEIAVGVQMLPGVVGRVSKFSSEGGFRIQRNLPTETVYRDAEITDWHGHTHFVSIPYQRFPRVAIPAPSIELTFMNDANDNLILAAPLQTNSPNEYGGIKHIMNLFFEYFGECDILQENLLPAFNVDVTRLNWNVLPKGNYPWDLLRNNVQEIINNAPPHRQQITERRIQTISANTPDFVAIGSGGFKGYIIFGFTGRNTYILESLYTGNATYVLGQNWQTVSQLTKEQILNQNLHTHRFIHKDGWDTQINQLLA